MADSKSWKLALGDRGTPGSDPITEMVRANMAKKQQKETAREDELEDLDFKAKKIQKEKEITGEEKTKMAELEKENKGLYAEAQKKEIDRVEQSLGSKVDKLAESIAGSIKQQPGIVIKGEYDIREGEKRAAEDAQRAREDAKEERERREKAEKETQSQRDIAHQKQIDTLTEKQSSQSLPAEIQLEMKKMDNNIQLQLEQMRDDRDRRDKEWQLTLRKWDEEKDIRREELSAKITIEKDKLDTIKGIGTRITNAVVEGAMEGSGETPAIASKPAIAGKKYTIDAGEGEEGEFNCPKCNSVVGIATDTITAMCASCGMNFPIRRVASKGKTQTMPAAQAKAESEQAGEEQIQAEGEQVGQAENPESDSEYSGASA